MGNNSHPLEVDDVVIKKKMENNEDKKGRKRDRENALLFKALPTPINLDRYPEIEFAHAHKKERNFQAPSSQKCYPELVIIFTYDLLSLCNLLSLPNLFYLYSSFNCIS